MQLNNNDHIQRNADNILDTNPSPQTGSVVIHMVNKARRQRILDELRHELGTDLLGVDAKWLLFGMAMQSYRYESLLLPYPPVFCTPAGYNINGLNLAMGTMPDFNRIHQKLLDNVLSVEQLEMLHWLIIESGTPHLLHLTNSEQLQLWRELGQKPQPRPQLVFRVEAGNMPTFSEQLDVSRCIFYCGGMDQLYRLLASPKRDVLHTDLEFFDELQEACANAELSPGWGYSLCGTLLRCVAICQMYTEAVNSDQLLHVRYLLFYSMNYSQKMHHIRRAQWKLIEQNMLQQSAQNVDEQLLVESERDTSLDRQSVLISERSPLFTWLSNKLKLFVVLGVLTFTVYKLRPWA